MPQLKYFQSEVFELNEAIIRFDVPRSNLFKEDIAGEIADVMVMLKQFQYNYGIKDEDVEDIMKYKIERQLNRIAKGDSDE